MTDQQEAVDQPVAIITGAGQGIGLEIARTLGLQGARIVLNDIDQILTKKAIDQLTQEGLNCTGLAGDAAELEVIRQLVDTAVKHYGKLDIAIANAGITVFGDFFSYTPEDLQRVMKLNLQGSFFLVQTAAKQMQAQQSGGSILLMSSVTGHQAHKNLAAYGMTKAALEMLAKSLVVDLSPLGITINAIAPGATLTERTLEDPEYLQTWSRITPMGRPATVSDIAQAAAFLVSPAAKHITGQYLIIDGGWTAVSPSPY